ncbi:hypothetical protein FKM82_008004 [Ascaphus truei]
MSLSLAVTVSVNAEVHADLGSHTTLSCRVQTTENVTQVAWQRVMTPHNENFLTYSRGEDPNYLTPFARRVIFLGGGDYDGSIMIQNVTLSDEGGYLCIFTTFPSGLKEREIRLIVHVHPAIAVVPAADPVVSGLLHGTMGVCIAGAAKPAANITWIVKGFSYNSEETTTPHDNGTVTTQSQLTMVPFRSLNGHEVACSVSQPYLAFKENRTFTIRNIHYAPYSVHVKLYTSDDGSAQLLCDADSNPPVTDFIWRRVNESVPDSIEELGTGPLFPASYASGLYLCEARNIIGSASESVYIHTNRVSDPCYAYILIILLVPSLIVNGVFSYLLWKRKYYNDGSDRSVTKRKKETSENEEMEV